MEVTIIKKTLKYWHLPLLAGALLIALGVWSTLTPIGSFLALTVFLSAGIALAGLLELIYAFSNRKRLNKWRGDLMGGTLNLIVGLCLISNPGFSALMLSVFIGLWMLFRSAMATIHAFEIKRQGARKWGWVLVAGISGVVFSLILLWNPVFLGITAGVWIGMGLVLVGGIHVLLSLLLRKLKKYYNRFRSELEG